MIEYGTTSVVLGRLGFSLINDYVQARRFVVPNAISDCLSRFKKPPVEVDTCLLLQCLRFSSSNGCGQMEELALFK